MYVTKSPRIFPLPIAISKPQDHLLIPSTFLQLPKLSKCASSALKVKSSLGSSTPPPQLATIETAVRVDILSESLPFIQKFRGKVIVVKYGGAAMKSPELQASVVSDVVLLSCMGMLPVLVHGGGPEINQQLGQLGIRPQFVDGLRVTDASTMEIVEMVLVGKVNKSLVSLINKVGGTAVGLCGKDGRLLLARPSAKSSTLGFVGDVARVDPTILKPIISAGLIPVIASVAADDNGQAYNINADTVAGELAAALEAEKLILLTDVPGILENKEDPKSLVKEIDIKGVRKMVEDEKVAGGMIPKVNCCTRSLAQGVRTASIIDGRVPHSLLIEIMTEDGAGTMITG